MGANRGAPDPLLAMTRGNGRDGLKRDQIGRVSHDLRASLNAIVGWAEIIRTSALDDDLRTRAGETILAHARLLTKRMDETLDLWRIGAGLVTITPAPARLPGVLQAAMQAAGSVARSRQVRWQLSLDSEDFYVPCDADRLRQALTLLLSHAAAHAPLQGTVAIELGARPPMLELRVRDDGPPLAQETSRLLFGRAPSMSSPVPASSPVRGAVTPRPFDVALLLAHAILQLHQGTLSWQHPEESGSGGFCISLPSLALAERPGPTDGDGVLAGLRLLVVDDDAGTREALAGILRFYDAEVQLAASAAEALHVLDQSSIDVLLSDIGMPDLDGYELLRQVRARPRLAGLPAAAVTACTTVEDQQRVKAAGFQMFVPKPIDPEQLVRAIIDVCPPGASM